jgi:hypothetical protein
MTEDIFWKICGDIDKKYENCALSSSDYNALKQETNNFQEDKIEECLRELVAEIQNTYFLAVNNNKIIELKIKTLLNKRKNNQYRDKNNKTEIIMGDKIQIRDISNNKVSIAIKENVTGAPSDDNIAKKSFHWHKWGVILATIIGVIGLVVMILGIIR